MHNLTLLEEYYKKFIKGLNSWIPECIYVVNLELLHHFDLLHFQPQIEHPEPNLMCYFHIFESAEKITLINDEFIIWIMPEKGDLQQNLTYIFIALNRGDREPQLEVVFIASGVYNSSKLVLRVLEQFLIEIQEMENTLTKFQEAG